MSINNHLTIQLPQFEGPLALLLYLIRKEEMDILNIEVHRITAQYLEFIKLMKELDLELAGEFVAMAATLIQIKSRLLLPQYDDNGEVIEGEDPRKELVQRLMEYQKYQEAGRMLYERPLLGRDLWPRGLREKLEVSEEEIALEENPLFGLISAYRRAVKTAQAKVHKVTTKLQSIASRILELKELLQVGVRKRMSELLTSIQHETSEAAGQLAGYRRKQGLITFLSLLELAKLGFVSLFQTDVFQDIHIETRKPIETDVISRVEEYDNLHSEEAASQMILKSNLGTMELHETLEDSDLQQIESAGLNSSQDSETTDRNEATETSEVADNAATAATDQEILDLEKELGLTNEAAIEVI